MKITKDNVREGMELCNKNMAPYVVLEKRNEGVHIYDKNVFIEHGIVSVDFVTFDKLNELRYTLSQPTEEIEVGDEVELFASGDTIIEALGDMLIYLIENKLLNVKDIKL